MISLHPNFSIPAETPKEFTLMVVGDEILNFDEYEGHEIIGTYTDALLLDLIELESMQLLPGDLTVQNVDVALKHMKIVYTISGSISNEWTDVLRETLKIKFMLQKNIY